MASGGQWLDNPRRAYWEFWIAVGWLALAVGIVVEAERWVYYYLHPLWQAQVLIGWALLRLAGAALGGWQ